MNKIKKWFWSSAGDYAYGNDERIKKRFAYYIVRILPLAFWGNID